MQVAFRVDASVDIGIGHVMRCLTLADAITIRGADCHFICRAHQGNLINYIRSKGYFVHELPVFQGEKSRTLSAIEKRFSDSYLAHSGWLGCTQAQDALACTSILKLLQPDWLILDHYALDSNWESSLASYFGKLMVIDDLADRMHDCSLLLDQTFGREVGDYLPLISSNCHVLCGSNYVLMRAEFAAFRHYSLQRRHKTEVRELLITMGGVDKNNATGRVLQALRSCNLPKNCRITVIMGETAPWLNEVKSQSEGLPWEARVLVGVNNMAKIMADSDLAIGAAGATSWERCCLGLPTFMLVLAENQSKVAHGLVKAGAAALITSGTSGEYQLNALFESLSSNPNKLRSMSLAAAQIADGTGTNEIVNILKS